MGSEPIDKKLYSSVKSLADKKFSSKTGIYKSSWIVKEYKRRGGKYKGKPTSSGLRRWFKEKWINLNSPIKNSKGKVIGYKSCGRKSTKDKNKYPLCRPSHRVSSKTPRTYKELKRSSINKAKREKAIVKGSHNIKFGGSITKKINKSSSLYNKKCDCKNDSCKCSMLKKICKDDKCSTLKKICKDDKCSVQQIGSGEQRSQYYGKHSSIMVHVPENVKKTALYSFKLKKLGFKGGLETGWKRAKQLATRESIPIEDLRYMRAWFARHVYTSYPTYKKWLNAGRPKDSSWHNKHGIIAWLIWAGDAAFKWVNSQANINLLNKHFNKNYKSIKLPK